MLSPMAASLAKASAERIREAPGCFLLRDTKVPNSTMSPVNTLSLYVDREVQCPVIEPRISTSQTTKVWTRVIWAFLVILISSISMGYLLTLRSLIDLGLVFSTSSSPRRAISFASL